MMELLKLKTSGDIEFIKYNEQNELHQILQKEMDWSMFEGVRTSKTVELFGEHVMMLVDESGQLKNKPTNPVASIYYGYDEHGATIAGDVVFCQYGFINDEMDLVELSEETIIQIIETSQKIYHSLLFGGY